MSDKTEEIAEKIANDFLEIASEQRLSIILKLNEKKSKISSMAKELDATVPEVHRNFKRLVKADLIRKDTDANYHLTLYGKTICTQIPTIRFMSQNKKYFKNHDFGDMPIKFIQTIGALVNNQLINGNEIVREQWKGIYKNSRKYVFNLVVELAYTSDFIDQILKKLKNNVQIHTIFSESVKITKERKNTIKKFDFKKFIEKGNLERRMRKDVKVAIILNENEAGIMFPRNDGEVDMSKMLYSSDSSFHEWCYDYFKYCWENSASFQESKIR